MPTGVVHDRHQVDHPALGIAVPHRLERHDRTGDRLGRREDIRDVEHLLRRCTQDALLDQPGLALRHGFLRLIQAGCGVEAAFLAQYHDRRQQTAIEQRHIDPITGLRGQPLPHFVHRSVSVSCHQAVWRFRRRIDHVGSRPVARVHQCRNSGGAFGPHHAWHGLVFGDVAPGDHGDLRHSHGVEHRAGRRRLVPSS